jgi:hypothetical protein
VQRVRDVSYFPRVKTRLCVRVFARAGTPKNPWYPTAPTAPIFGQPSMGDWDSVMVEVGRELQITEVFDPNENLNDPQTGALSAGLAIPEDGRNRQRCS